MVLVNLEQIKKFSSMSEFYSYVSSINHIDFISIGLSKDNPDIHNYVILIDFLESEIVQVEFN